MPKIDTVVIGASAGGVEALISLVRQLPANFGAAILIVVHFPENSTSVLPAILNRNGQLPVQHAEDGMLVQPGNIYTAPPGRHLLLRQDRLVLVRGPRENGNRPAIDPLFRSAAQSCGPATVSVLLTGLLDDGTLGTAAVNRRGGVSIAQDPEDAMFGDMPRNAIQTVGVTYVLPLHEIGAKLVELVGTPVPDWETEEDVDPVEMTLNELQDLESTGRPSAYVCPECQGTLFELSEEGVLHYRCRVGHSYLPDTLVSNQESALEAALWTAMRAIKEHNALIARMLETAEKKGFTVTASSYRAKLYEGARRLDLIRSVVGVPMGNETEEVNDDADDKGREGSAE